MMMLTGSIIRFCFAATALTAPLPLALKHFCPSSSRKVLSEWQWADASCYVNISNSQCSIADSAWPVPAGQEEGWCDWLRLGWLQAAHDPLLAQACWVCRRLVLQ